MTKKVMSDYSCFCTEEQTKKALELGAPIEFETECPYDWEQGKRSPYPDVKVGKDGEPIFILPTAEQMIGFLEEQKIIRSIEVTESFGWHYRVKKSHDDIENWIRGTGQSRKEATLAAIDAALEYLTQKYKL